MRIAAGRATVGNLAADFTHDPPSDWSFLPPLLVAGYRDFFGRIHQKPSTPLTRRLLRLRLRASAYPQARRLSCEPQLPLPVPQLHTLIIPGTRNGGRSSGGKLLLQPATECRTVAFQSNRGGETS